ncbi:hypothetical protein NXV02_19530 [Bacteroides ovatus]|uniref:hypothetical protein n=1 Tax=Bacteroides ovatus TaxID=28116 RepID=UPI0021645B5B|nr:hypothetical protein [Bacteroides ovatus]MCS2525210.1 hypothetical protein [Bacteroides ovatus]UVQ36154.1 hypothetical protein NXU82_19415 [Bacteroides ovatus]
MIDIRKDSIYIRILYENDSKVDSMTSHIGFWLKKKSFGKSNCFAFRIFQTREKWIEEAESNKSSYFPQLKHCFSLLKAPLSFS